MSASTITDYFKRSESEIDSEGESEIDSEGESEEAPAAKKQKAPWPPADDAAQPRPQGQVVKKEKYVWISSFGRRQIKNGARFFGETTPSGYRGTMMVKLKCYTYRPYAHAMVHVLFNDAQLDEYRAFHAEHGKYPTVDHIDPAFSMKSENHHSNLRWATKKEQVTNQIRTAEGKASIAIKISVGRVQYREEGAEWDDEHICINMRAAERATGHYHADVGKWLGDGKVHKHRLSGKRFEYRARPFEVEEGFEDEKWFVYPPLPGFLFSDYGRLREGNRPPQKGCKSGSYRSFVYNRLTYRVHDFIGRIFFGEPPSPEHTIDHYSKDLDADGCLSNAVSNLVGWADRSEQATTARNGSNVESGGKPMLVTNLATGEVHRYTDAMTAGRAHGMSSEHMGRRANGFYKQYGKLHIEWEPQPDLVRANTTIVNGRVQVELEVEAWKKLDPVDFEPGGKYHILVTNAWEQGKKTKKRDLSKGIKKKKG